MGLALARACRERGWPVTLLLGPVTVAAPAETEDSRLSLYRFRTTGDLQSLLREHWPSHDLLFMAAAVADFRPASISAHKIERGQPISLTLEPTPDLLAEAAIGARPDQMTIGFALEETNTLLERATRKLARKGATAIVANPIETMDSDSIAGTLVLSSGATREPPQHSLSKEAFAQWLVGEVERLRAELPPHFPR